MKRILLVLALMAVIALPLFLRPKQSTFSHADRTLLIMSPHNEAIRFEFSRGFERWYKKKTGYTVSIDWRVVGGTSDIARFLESEYIASFHNYWTNKLGKLWSMDVQAAFANAKLPKDMGAIAKEARQAFLASNVGCGIDLFFGGGTFDFSRQADAGRLVDSGIIQMHPEWFTEDVIPKTFTGEFYWDEQGRWFGDVLSSYGIIYNFDALKRLGITHAPDDWSDLADPMLEGEVALCDPTKSGSMAKAFENVIQEQIYIEIDRLAKITGKPEAEVEADAVRSGWLRGMRLLQRIGANARYFTDSSQKLPIDVLQGDSAVGMCIDFYGHYQEEVSGRRANKRRLGFYSPARGTSYSPDPVGILRGAPNRDVAVAFIEYCLSMEGQLLWNLKVGTEGGTERFALRRLPIRKDFYQNPTYSDRRSDPTINPFGKKKPLFYNSGWTGGIFREMALVIRVMCEDTHEQLVDAWRKIIAAGMPSVALDELGDISFVSYEQMFGPIKKAVNPKNKVEEVQLASDLAAKFRKQYARAAAIAEKSRR